MDGGKRHLTNKQNTLRVRRKYLYNHRLHKDFLHGTQKPLTIKGKNLISWVSIKWKASTLWKSPLVK